MSHVRRFNSLHVFFVYLLISLFVVSGCASQSPVMEESASYDFYEAPAAERGVGSDASPSESAPPKADSFDSLGGAGFDLGEVAEISHKIIYSGEIVLESLLFDESVEGVQSYVNSMGGYAESSFIEGRRITSSSKPPRRTAVFTFRIPQQKFHSFSEGLKTYGNILSSSTHGENITEQYFDTDARLTSLKIQEERMLSLLEKADSIEDILRIESELTHLRYQIESLTGTLQKWDNLVQFSTIRVEIREVDEVTPDPGSSTWLNEVGDAFKDSILAVIQTLQNLIIFLIMAIPFAIVFIPLFILLRKLYGKFKSRKKKNQTIDHNEH